MPLPSSLRKASQLLEEFHHFTRRNKIMAVSKNWGPTPLVLFCLLTYLTPAVSKHTNRNICRICRLAPLANRSFSCLTRTRRLHQSQSTSQIMPLGSCWFRQACTACKKPLPCTCHNVQAGERVSKHYMLPRGRRSLSRLTRSQTQIWERAHTICFIGCKPCMLRKMSSSNKDLPLSLRVRQTRRKRICHPLGKSCWDQVAQTGTTNCYCALWLCVVYCGICICPSYPILSDPIQSIHLSSATINLSLDVVTHQKPEIGKNPLQNLPLNNRKL